MIAPAESNQPYTDTNAAGRLWSSTEGEGAVPLLCNYAGNQLTKPFLQLQMATGRATHFVCLSDMGCLCQLLRFPAAWPRRALQPATLRWEKGRSCQPCKTIQELPGPTWGPKHQGKPTGSCDISFAVKTLELPQAGQQKGLVDEGMVAEAPGLECRALVWEVLLAA